MTIYDRKADWLASTEYAEFRRAIIRSQNGACGRCERALPLEIHHCSYDFGPNGWRHEEWGIPWGSETKTDVVALCRECHLNEHVDSAGMFWADPDEKSACSIDSY